MRYTFNYSGTRFLSTDYSIFPTDMYWSVLLVPEGFSQISSENVAFLAKGIEVGMYSDYNPAFKLLTAEMRMC